MIDHEGFAGARVNSWRRSNARARARLSFKSSTKFPSCRAPRPAEAAERLFNSASAFPADVRGWPPDTTADATARSVHEEKVDVSSGRSQGCNARDSSFLASLLLSLLLLLSKRLRHTSFGFWKRFSCHTTRLPTLLSTPPLLLLLLALSSRVATNCPPLSLGAGDCHSVSESSAHGKP